MKRKVLVTSSFYDDLCGEGKAMLLEKGYELEINHKDVPFYTFDELAVTMHDVDAAIVGTDLWTEEVYRLSPNLKCIAKFGVGVDNIDLQKAKDYGIKVVNARGQNSNAVAELVVGLMIDCLRSISLLSGMLKKGCWQRKAGGEIEGKTIGFIGFGSIAQLVSTKLQGFNVHQIAYDVFPNQEIADKLNVKLVDLPQLLSASDIVSLHIPATKDNYHFMNKQRFSAMKKGSYFINTARGSLVSLDDLCDSIETGYLAGAALDVYEEEPLPGNSRVLLLPGVITVPHIGADTIEVYRNIGISTAKSVIDVFEGRIPANWLNP